MKLLGVIISCEIGFARYFILYVCMKQLQFLTNFVSTDNVYHLNIAILVLIFNE